MLRPEEEALVDAVLSRPPTDIAETDNPFALSGQEADPEAARARTPLHTPRTQQGSPSPQGTASTAAWPHTPPAKGASQGHALPSSPMFPSSPGSAPVSHSVASLGRGGGMLVLPGGESAADIAAAVTGHASTTAGELLFLSLYLNMQGDFLSACGHAPPSSLVVPSPPGSASVCHSVTSLGRGGGMLVLPGGESAADIAAAVTGHASTRAAAFILVFPQQKELFLFVRVVCCCCWGEESAADIAAAVTGRACTPAGVLLDLRKINRIERALSGGA